jgi:hypothetical protein
MTTAERDGYSLHHYLGRHPFPYFADILRIFIRTTAGGPTATTLAPYGQGDDSSPADATLAIVSDWARGIPAGAEAHCGHQDTQQPRLVARNSLMPIDVSQNAVA